MVEFLRKFDNRGIKSARVNSILITKYINLQLFTFIIIRRRGSFMKKNIWQEANGECVLRNTGFKEMMSPASKRIIN